MNRFKNEGRHLSIKNEIFDSRLENKKKTALPTIVVAVSSVLYDYKNKNISFNLCP